MKKVVLDPELRAKVGGGRAKATFTDEDGKVVGHYIPDDLFSAILEVLTPSTTAENRAAALEEYRRGECLTTEQVLQSMREARRRWSGEE